MSPFSTEYRTTLTSLRLYCLVSRVNKSYSLLKVNEFNPMYKPFHKFIYLFLPCSFIRDINIMLYDLIIQCFSLPFFIPIIPSNKEFKNLWIAFFQVRLWTVFLKLSVFALQRLLNCTKVQSSTTLYQITIKHYRWIFIFVCCLLIVHVIVVVSYYFFSFCYYFMNQWNTSQCSMASISTILCR